MSKAKQPEILWTRKRIWDLYGLLWDDATEHMSKFLDTFRDAKARLHKLEANDAAGVTSIILKARSEWEQLGAASANWHQEDFEEKEEPGGQGARPKWSLPLIDFAAFSGLTSDMELTLDREIEHLLDKRPLEGNQVRALNDMQDPFQRDLRQFLFEGEMQEVLYRYRDIGEVLPPSTQSSGAKLIEQGMESIRAGMRTLDASILVELSFTARDWEDKWQVMEKMEDLAQKYRLAFGPELGTISSKADSGLEKREFALACGLVCLRHYGFAPKWAISRLLDLRSVGTGQRPLADVERGNLKATTDHWINGQLQVVRDRVLKLAEKHNWPTWLLIESTSNDSRLRVVNTPPIEVIPETSGKGVAGLGNMTDWSGSL